MRSMLQHRNCLFSTACRAHAHDSVANGGRSGWALQLSFRRAQGQNSPTLRAAPCRVRAAAATAYNAQRAVNDTAPTIVAAELVNSASDLANCPYG